jgi:hypothetical protein
MKLRLSVGGIGEVAALARDVELRGVDGAATLLDLVTAAVAQDRTAAVARGGRAEALWSRFNRKMVGTRWELAN